MDSEVECGANVTALETPGGTIYLDARDVAGFAPAPAGHDGDYIWSVWVYLEANDHPGMQTVEGTISLLDEANAENCTTSAHKSLDSDELIY